MSFNIPRDGRRRVVVVGGGFGGLRLCNTLARDPNFQVILIDRNNYHQFPPLIYQIATAGLQVSSIAFPFRKLFEKRDNLYFRMCELRAVYPSNKVIQTSIGKLDYDELVIATGTTTNYFGNKKIQDESIPMKTIGESLGLRNALLNTFERANTCSTEDERRELLNIVIVGGGPTGVEIAGALAEMREHVLPSDYPDLNTNLMQIHLLQGGSRLLPAMSKTASAAALKYLENLGVDVQLNAKVVDYDQHHVLLSDGRKFKSLSLIWVCGVTGVRINGIPDSCYGPGNRLLVDAYNKVEGVNNIYAIGDIALMKLRNTYPFGHPQMAQAAIQQGNNLALNFIRKNNGEFLKRFEYRDLGSMATIGRNKAVADIAGMNLTGFIAWFLWMGVHLMSILGVKNKLATMLDWAWSYFTYDKSNRTMITAKHPKVQVERNFEMSMRHWGEMEEEQTKAAVNFVRQKSISNRISELEQESLKGHTPEETAQLMAQKQQSRKLEERIENAVAAAIERQAAAPKPTKVKDSAGAKLSSDSGTNAGTKTGANISAKAGAETSASTKASAKSAKPRASKKSTQA